MRSHPRHSRESCQNQVFDSGEGGYGDPTEGDHNLFSPHIVSKYRSIIHHGASSINYSNLKPTDRIDIVEIH